MKYLSTKEIAKKWKMTDRMVRNYCSNGRISNCKLKGKTWVIAENATIPVRKKRISNKKKRLLDILKEEKKAKLSGRIYHKLQIEMTYNSNHIEGSTLTHDQTALIFDTKTIGNLSSSTKVDDVIETINHFRCIDYVIDNADKILNENFIKHLHLLLKQNTVQSSLDWFNVGEYKALENEVAGRLTTSPKKVSSEMKKILNLYNKKDKVSLNDIIDFHYRFEYIHPFQDGNGRVGRLIILKECLKHNFVPIIILDEFKSFYYRGLKEYKNERGYLIDTCLHGQDIFKEYLNRFKIKY